MAILAHGLQTIAPTRHKKLADRILESGGALVAEYRFGQEPLPANFVKRDRIQAGFAQGVVMIQSDLVGGSLHASRASIGYGRWLTVPYPTDQDVSRSEPRIQANLLLADGNLKERAALLKCEQNDLERIITLRSKSDYVRMLEGYPLADHQAPPIQEAVEDLFSRPQAIDIASAPQTSAKASRDDQFLLEHIIMVEEQLKLHHRSIAEHGQAIKNSDHYKKMMHDFDQLKLSLLRVLEEDLKFGQK